MTSRRTWLILLAIFLAGAVAGYLCRPARVVTKIEVQEKIVTVTEKAKANDVVVVHREIRRPDGTTVIRIVTVDKSVLQEETKSETVTARSEVKTVERDSSQWNVRAMAGLTFTSQTAIYGLGAERRILGPFFLGAYLFSNGAAGASLALSF